MGIVEFVVNDKSAVNARQRVVKHTPGSCFTNSDGPSDQATDHCPMLFVHSRMVRPKSDSPSLLVKQPPDSEEASSSF